MAARAPYCTADDMLLGDLQVPRNVSIDQWILSTAEEMDAWLGQVYKLPIQLDPMTPGHQADILLLKKINRFLATGRIIISANAAASDSRLHAYGAQLISDAERELARITAGRTVLEGGELLVEEVMRSQPLIITHRDAHSYVDTFYNSKGTSHVNRGLYQ